MQPVLIVEDNKDLQKIYKMALETAGVSVIVKKNGLEAISDLKKINPSLILLDILMPDIDGVTFLKMINEQNATKYPVIVLSNLSSKKTIDDCMELGCIDYIIKADTSVAMVVNRIRDFLKQKMEEEKEPKQ